jgi:hypothetical protein
LLRHWDKLNAAAYRPPPGDAELVDWVIRDLSITGNPKETFQTAGELYVFSSLRPAAPPDGSLRMTTIDETWLNVLLFGSLAVVGLALLRVRLTGQLIAVAGIVIALILSGVFLPTFSLQVFDAELFAALFAVAVLWAAWHVIRWQPWRRWSLPFAAAAMTAAGGAASDASAASTPSAATPFAATPEASEPQSESSPAEKPAAEKPAAEDRTEGGPDHA